MSLTKVSYSMITGAPVNVADFGAVGNGTTDDTAAIQAAINSLPVAPTTGVGAVLLAPNANYRITAPLVLQRGQSLIGDGTPRIIADFASWTGDLVAIKFVVQQADSSAKILNAFSQSSYGFTLTGKNNSAVVSVGMKFYTTVSITVAQAVNYSYIGSIKDITIAQFDTAMELLEANQVQFINIRIYSCVNGVYIHGKCVNLNFIALNITNPSNSYSSSTANTIGININSGFHYTAGAEGRPEGLYFNAGLIYGCYNNVFDNRSLMSVFDNMIIDGATNDCFRISTPDELLITNCYLYTSGSGSSCIQIDGTAAATSSAITIENNTLVGTSPTNTCYGVNFTNSGLSRYGVNIIGNSGNLLTTMVKANLTPSYSVIKNNYAESITGSLIFLQNGGVKTIVDGNTTSSSVAPLELYFSTVDASLNIGFNASATYVTQYKGKATLLSGTTSIALPNNFYGATDVKIRPITSVTFNANPGANWWVTELASNSDATLNVASAPGTNLAVHYTVTAIPLSAY
jgi:polygalacturonase